MMTEEQKHARIESLTFRLKTLDLLEEDGIHIDVVERDSYRIALAALTQPASPALKLPDAVIPSVHLNSNARSAADAARNGGKIDGWNLCFAEVVRLNAPHTAPIEPICATGGAEWVKVSERMPRHRQSVLGWQEKPGTVIECYPEGIKWYYDYSDGPCGNVTHWMPLPAAPEEE